MANLEAPASGKYASHLLEAFGVQMIDKLPHVVSDAIKHYDKTIYKAPGSLADEKTLLGFLVPQGESDRKGVKSIQIIVRGADGAFKVQRASVWNDLKSVRPLSVNIDFSNVFSVRSSSGAQKA